MRTPAPDAPPAPQVLVVVGATGDLARRKLFPALYRLRQLDLLPRPFRIICSGRSAPDSVCTFTETLRAAVEMNRGAVDRAAWHDFVGRISVVPTSDDGAELEQPCPTRSRSWAVRAASSTWRSRHRPPSPLFGCSARST